MRLALHRLETPFLEPFRHASAERTRTASIIVVAAESGVLGFGEGCPRSYVTDETLDSAESFFAQMRREGADEITSLEMLRGFIERKRSDIDRNPAAWCAIELALLDLFSRQRGCSVEALLGRPKLSGDFCYSAVVGDAAADAFSVALARYRKAGFSDFKIKLAGDFERDRKKLESLRAIDDGGLRVRADANNLWSDAELAVEYLRRLDYGFFAIEEPLRPRDWPGLAELATRVRSRVILDESVARCVDLDQLPSDVEGWIINVRVSKMGGVLRALEVVERARLNGCGVIVGAQVGETSLLTRAALTVASAASGILIAQEGAFGTWLLERDICSPVVMFGEGGVLAAAQLPMAHGWGLDVEFKEMCSR